MSDPKINGRWTKVSNLAVGMKIAVPLRGSAGGSVPVPDIDGNVELSNTDVDVMWDEIASITPVGREQVYDIEVEGTHNFIGNDIFAHNTYVVRSGNLSAAAPEELTADGTDVDLAKLATYTLSEEQKLAAKVDAGEVEMASLEARVEALESGQVAAVGALDTANGSAVDLATSTILDAFKSFGVLIQRGIAQFNTLVFRQLVASKDADGTSSAGSVSILTGNTVAVVTNSLVLPTTKVFITFNSEIAGSWWVADKTDGSFRVVLSQAQMADVSFDYFLVQTEGQIATPDAQPTLAPNSQDQTLNPTSPSSEGNTAPVVITPDTATSTPPAGAAATSTPTDAGSQTSPASGDTTPPAVTLNGDAAMQLNVGVAFIDAGATATDDVDGALTPVVTGSVDTATAGVYTLTYTATDAAGNSANVSRVVTVVEAPAPAETPAP